MCKFSTPICFACSTSGPFLGGIQEWNEGMVNDKWPVKVKKQPNKQRCTIFIGIIKGLSSAKSIQKPLPNNGTVFVPSRFD